MNTVQSVMIALIRSCFTDEKINNNTRELITPELLQKVYSLSKKQDLVHLVAYALHKNDLLTNDEIGAKLHKAQMMAVMRYEQINYEYNRICTCLENAQVQFIPLKGSVLRAYYPQEWMRTSCDIDILIHPQDLDKAQQELVQKLGYEQGERSSYEMSFHSKSGVHLELHTALAAQEHKCSNVLSQAWDHAVPKKDGAYHYIFTNEMFYFYHIAHMAIHFEFGGCGVRPFLDLWLLNNRENFDIDKCKPLLDEGRLFAFAQAATKLANVWFSEYDADELTAQMEDFIMRAGIYGNIDNKIAAQQSKKGSKVKYAMSRIFLPYAKLSAFYPSLKGHRWLTPIYQVRRWLKLVFCGGIKRSAKELSVNARVTDTKKVQVGTLMQKLDLI